MPLSALLMVPPFDIVVVAVAYPACAFQAYGGVTDMLGMVLSNAPECFGSEAARSPWRPRQRTELPTMPWPTLVVIVPELLTMAPALAVPPLA